MFLSYQPSLHAAGIHHWAAVCFETPAQFHKLFLVRHKFQVFVRQMVARERLESWRRHVAARGISARAALPFLRQVPRDEKPGGVGVGRFLQNRLRGEEHRSRKVLCSCRGASYFKGTLLLSSSSQLSTTLMVCGAD